MDIYCTFDFAGGQEESRRLLREVLGFYGAEELIDKIEISDKGKPSIPGWHHFSISHSENCWAVLIDENPCGLDIQYPRKCSKNVIAERWYATEDAEAVVEDTDEFWRVWTRREASVKAIGGSVFEELPSVLGQTIVLGEDEWYLEDIELIGAEVIPYGAICTKYLAKTINYYRI